MPGRLDLDGTTGLPSLKLEDDRRVVVIGTGPAGAAAAWELHRAGIAVTVLEAGSRRSARGVTVRSPGLTLFRRKRPLPVPLVSRVAEDTPPVCWSVELSAGGLSNHWTCAVPRFSPEDFTDGERLDPKYRWPVSYRELVENYASMERLLQIGGSGLDVANLPGGEVSHRVRLADDWQPVVEQAGARGHGLTSLPLAYAGGWTITRSGTQFNSFVRLLESLPPTTRFRVFFGAQALRLEWSGERKRVTRVIFRDASSGTEGSVTGTAFVVAAGALNSTRLLLESNCPEFPRGLGNTDGVLGRYLHDHPLARLGLRLQRPLSIHPPAYLTRAPYAAAPPLRAVAGTLWSGTWLRLKKLLTRGKSDEIGFNLMGTIPPLETNGVALNPSHRDPTGGATLDLRVRFDDDTGVMLDRARERLLEILDAAGFRASVNHWLVEQIGVSVHYGGTVRMHLSPRYGMLDAWNRLHAVPNVLVVDSSAFTTGPEKNPTLTAMALASRAAQRLARELRF